MGHVKRRAPGHLIPAVLSGDLLRLSAAGRKGAEVTNRKRDVKAAVEAELRKRAEAKITQELSERAIEANEHLADVDGSFRHIDQDERPTLN